MASRRNRRLTQPHEIDWNRQNLSDALRIHDEMEAQYARENPRPANPLNLGRPLSKDEVRAMLANSPKLC